MVRARGMVMLMLVMLMRGGQMMVVEVMAVMVDR